MSSTNVKDSSRECPKCGFSELPPMLHPSMISQTVRCPRCDCSIGMSRIGPNHVVYDPLEDTSHGELD